MVWKKIANLRGPAGYNALGTEPQQQTVAAWLRGSSGANAVEAALTELTGLNVRNFGAVGDGVTDDSAAIQAACDALMPGQKLYFPPRGSTNSFYKAHGIVITVPWVTWVGSPRDGYAVSVRSDVPGSTIVTDKAGGFVLEDIGLIGDADVSGPSGGTNGEGATVTGLALMGTPNGDVDAAIRGATFQWLAVGIRLYGRNAEVSENTLFSNCLKGILHDGKDATYHTGPAADENRGHIFRDCRFHNIGTSPADAAIEFTDKSNLIHAIIDTPHIDSNGKGRGIVVSGSTVAPARGLTILNPKITESTADAITLVKCQYPVVENVTVLGINGVGGHGIVLTDCLYPVVDGVNMRGIGKDGIRGTGNTAPMIANAKLVQIGSEPGLPNGGSAFNFDATNADVKLVNPNAHTATGWFFTGSPTGDSVIIDGSYTGMAKGGIDSLTVANHSKRGRNSYVEGRSGRVEDTGYGQYDLAAGTPKLIATATAGGTFGSFILEIELSGRDSVTGNLYFSGKRFVRPENGTPIVATLGTDAAAGVTVTIAASGNSGVTVTAQAANANWVGARVRAVAGGAASGTVSRSVSVTMAAQP